MKKLKTLLIISFMALFATPNAFAASGSLSVSSSSVYVGDSFTASVNLTAVAAWSVKVTASGPVSGCVINQADATADANNANKTFSAQCTATGAGAITITLSGDATNADGETVTLGGTRTVTAAVKPAPTTTQKPAQTPAAQTPETTEAPAEEEQKSNNSNLGELSVEDYAIAKTDDHNYTLAVPRITDKIVVNATAEDEKATITGGGEHELKEGENAIKITITAEDGTKNKIILTVTRDEACAAPAQNTNKGDLNTGLIIVLIISIVINLALAITFMIFLAKKNKKPKKHNKPDDDDPFTGGQLDGPQKNPLIRN